MLDRKTNPDADTGTFELAYRQVIPKAPAYLGLSLCINGKKLYQKKIKERRSERSEPKGSMSIMPCSRIPGGDMKEEVEPIPSEYNGPIITDFITWLNPYDTLPTNKDGLLLCPSNSNTVRHALTVVKSGLVLKSSAKSKRKSSTLSSRTRGRRERSTELRRRVKPHSCCLPVEEITGKQVGKYRTESASKIERIKRDNSVGNKRCYIDPMEWEKEVGGILRPTISIQNKMTSRSEPVIVQDRQTKTTNISSNRKSVNSFHKQDPKEVDDTNKLSAIGRNICKLRDDKKTNKEKCIKFTDASTSIYAPFVITSLTDKRKILTKYYK